MRVRPAVLLAIIITIVAIEIVFMLLDKFGKKDVGIAVLSTVLLYTLLTSSILNIYKFAAKQ